MKVNELYDSFWALADKGEPENLLRWINKLLRDNENNLDLKFIRLECLRWNHMDVEDDQEEPLVQNYCTDIIRNNEKHSTITLVKAYAYRGAIKYRAIDRVKDFDKARDVLKNLNPKNKEVKFMKQFIDIQYPFEYREYLFYDSDYHYLFKF